MVFAIEISDPPSTEGSTQTRRVGVTVTIPTPEEYDREERFTRVRLSIDGDQNGEYREVDERILDYAGGGTRLLTFEQLIGAQPPYTLKASAEFVLDGPDEHVETTRVIVAEDLATQDETIVADSAPTPEGVADLTEVTPKVGPVEPITMRATYDLPFNREQNITACGRTLQRSNGDLDWRIVFEGIITKGQLDELNSLRGQGTIRTRSAEFGVQPVAFDQLSVKRADDQSVVNIDGETGLLLQFQLQTKESTDSSQSLVDDRINRRGEEN